MAGRHAAETLDLLASFQRTVVEELLRRAWRSADEIARSNGDRLRRGGVQLGTALGGTRCPCAYPVLFPTAGLSTDNAAMIAAAAFPKLRRGEFADFGLKAQANLTLA